MPALFTRTPIRPKSARARSTIAARSLREVTSVDATLARRPSPCTSAAVRSAPARSSSATTISAPSRASSRAVARPMPRPAPVTIAIWSLSSIVVPLARRQRGERLHEAPGVAEDVPIQASLGAALLHLDARDDRAVPAERQVVRASELVLGAHLQCLLDTGAPRDRRQARAGGRGRRLAARGLVDLVVPDHEGEVAGGLGGDRAQRAEVHQQRPIAVQAHDAYVRARQRDAQRERGALSHRAVGVAVEGAVRDRLQLERRLAEIGDHDLARQALGETPGGGGTRQRHCSGVREAGVDRGWPATDARGVIVAGSARPAWTVGGPREARVASSLLPS